MGGSVITFPNGFENSTNVYLKSHSNEWRLNGSLATRWRGIPLASPGPRRMRPGTIWLNSTESILCEYTRPENSMAAQLSEGLSIHSHLQPVFVESLSWPRHMKKMRALATQRNEALLDLSGPIRQRKGQANSSPRAASLARHGQSVNSCGNTDDRECVNWTVSNAFPAVLWYHPYVKSNQTLLTEMEGEQWVLQARERRQWGGAWMGAECSELETWSSRQCTAYFEMLVDASPLGNDRWLRRCLS